MGGEDHVVVRVVRDDLVCPVDLLLGRVEAHLQEKELRAVALHGEEVRRVAVRAVAAPPGVGLVARGREVLVELLVGRAPHVVVVARQDAVGHAGVLENLHDLGGALVLQLRAVRLLVATQPVLDHVAGVHRSDDVAGVLVRGQPRDHLGVGGRVLLGQVLRIGHVRDGQVVLARRLEHLVRLAVRVAERIRHALAVLHQHVHGAVAVEVGDSAGAHQRHVAAVLPRGGVHALPLANSVVEEVHLQLVAVAGVAAPRDRHHVVLGALHRELEALVRERAAGVLRLVHLAYIRGAGFTLADARIQRCLRGSADEAGGLRPVDRSRLRAKRGHVGVGGAGGGQGRAVGKRRHPGAGRALDLDRVEGAVDGFGHVAVLRAVRGAWGGRGGDKVRPVVAGGLHAVPGVVVLLRLLDGGEPHAAVQRHTCRRARPLRRISHLAHVVVVDPDGVQERAGGVGDRGAVALLLEGGVGFKRVLHARLWTGHGEHAARREREPVGHHRGRVHHAAPVGGAVVHAQPGQVRGFSAVVDDLDVLRLLPALIVRAAGGDLVDHHIAHLGLLHLDR